MNEKKANGSDSVPRPVYSAKGFISFVIERIRNGLMIRYWITLPSMYRREMQWRKDFELTLQKFSDCDGKIIPLNDVPNAKGKRRRCLPSA